jgi:hypothetical protein
MRDSEVRFRAVLPAVAETLDPLYNKEGAQFKMKKKDQYKI